MSPSLTAWSALGGQRLDAAIFFLQLCNENRKLFYDEGSGCSDASLSFNAQQRHFIDVQGDLPHTPDPNDTGTWNAGDVYLPSYGFFNLSNISLPQDCSLLGNWTLQIGPWTVQSATSHEVTGCADLSNLNVHFSNPYQGQGPAHHLRSHT